MNFLTKGHNLKLLRIVIKISSAGLSLKEGGPDRKQFAKLAKDITWLMQNKIQVVLVSSGAIQMARPYMKHFMFDQQTEKGLMGQSPIFELQALSAIGQPKLMQYWSKAFDRLGVLSSQILLNHDDFTHGTPYLNAKNTLECLLKAQVLPILNENDTTSFEEIAFGDNDHLAAMTAQLVGADLLIFLTRPDGLFNGPPDHIDSQRYEIVGPKDKIPSEHISHKSITGRGGMTSKLKAISKMTALGIPVLVGSYQKLNPIKRLLTKNEGTLFLPEAQKVLNAKKGQLLAKAKSQCCIVVDEGAKNALLKGASLLPVGIKKVLGPFKRGDVIEVTYQHQILAFGPVECSSKELDQIKGLGKNDFQKIIPTLSVVIHRNNIILRET